MRLVTLACGLLLGALPGCVGVDSRQFTAVYHTTEIIAYRSHATTVEKDKPQPLPVTITVPPVIQAPRVVQTGCKPFVAPARQTLPVQPDFSNLGDEQLEEAIAGYIKELRSVIKLERRAFDEAHRQHLAGCKG